MSTLVSRAAAAAAAAPGLLLGINHSTTPFSSAAPAPAPACTGIPGLFNASSEPSLFPACAAAFHAAADGVDRGCPLSPVTWGCWSALAMSVLAAATLLLALLLAFARIVNQGSLWIRFIFATTLIEAVLLAVRYLVFADDRLVLVSETLEACVVLAAAYILSWICAQLLAGSAGGSGGDGGAGAGAGGDLDSEAGARGVYDSWGGSVISDRSLLDDGDDHHGHHHHDGGGGGGGGGGGAARSSAWLQCVVPILVAVLGGHVGVLGLALAGVLGDADNCYQQAWFFISAFRVVSVTVCLASAVAIQRKLRAAPVSELYRRAKMRLVWLLALVFVFATAVEVGNDAWAAISERSPGDCNDWVKQSVSGSRTPGVTVLGSGAAWVVVRVTVRVFKYFVPMWAIIALFRAVMPGQGRPVRERTISWASHGEDVWSNLSGHQQQQHSRGGGGRGGGAGTVGSYPGMGAGGLLSGRGGGGGGGGGGVARGSADFLDMRLTSPTDAPAPLGGRYQPSGLLSSSPPGTGGIQ